MTENSDSHLPDVYIIDDDDLIILSLTTTLKRSGFTPHSFNNATDFLKTELSESGCIILDLNMPDLNGLDVQQALLNRQQTLPIVIYSGSADVPSTVQALRDGAYTLLQKPASMQTMIDTIHDAINDHKTRLAESAKKQLAETKISMLSKRELDVAMLAADGLAASQIADRLFISTRTAEAHKANIFNKLEIKSIAPLARYLELAGYL